MRIQPEVVYDDGAASFRGYRPRAALRRYLELIWLVSGVPAVTNERVLPNGAFELILNLGPPHEVRRGEARTTYRRAWIAGLQQGPLDIGMLGEESTLVGIRFRPGGAHPVLGVPLDEVTDQVVEVEGAGTEDLRELRERLFDAASDAERIVLVERALLQRLAQRRWLPDPRVERAIAALSTPGGDSGDGVRIDEVSRLAGVSRKHLAELFRVRVGIGPKRLARILRFHAVVDALGGSRAPARWAELAHAHGYADQAHLVREFRVFAGIPPRAYLALRTIDPNHLELGAGATSSTRRGSSPSA